MSRSSIQLIETLKEKITLLQSMFTIIKGQNVELRQKNNELENKLNEQQLKIENLETEYKNLQIAKAVSIADSNDEHVKEAKSKIEEIVREINTCIALLDK